MHHYKGLVKPYVLWSFLLIVLPLALILLYSITTGDNSLITIHFTLDNFRKISDPIYLNVFIKSLFWHIQWRILFQSLMKVLRIF